VVSNRRVQTHYDHQAFGVSICMTYRNSVPVHSVFVCRVYMYPRAAHLTALIFSEHETFYHRHYICIVEHHPVDRLSLFVTSYRMGKRAVFLDMILDIFKSNAIQRVTLAYLAPEKFL